VGDEGGRVVGDAIGSSWGELYELQQLWVEAGHSSNGLGIHLLQEFESHAAQMSCKSFYLETLNFQVPEFYMMLGYSVAFTCSGYPHATGKFYMVKDLGIS